MSTEHSGAIAVTGASGFLGQAVIAELTAMGGTFVTIGRRPAGPENERAHHITLDLSTPEAGDRLTSAFADHGVNRVIHLAGQMAGNDDDHAAGTIAPTRAVLDALPKCGLIVLASSFSVYDYTALVPGALLTEDAPLEAHPARRDAYARAKLAQEKLVQEASSTGSFRARLLRPGVIVSPEKPWTARLGFTKSGFLMLLGGSAALPIISVQDCARAFVAAAQTPTTDDLSVYNIVGDHLPTQREYYSALKAAGRSVPGRAATAPYNALTRMSGALCAIPGLGSVMPSSLTPQSLAARANPLRYDNTAAKDHLNWLPRDRWQAAIGLSDKG